MSAQSERREPPLSIEDAPSADQQTQQLNVQDEQTLKFDKLGPVVVNTDGTLSRIPNWHEMAPIEQERTTRVISARNKARLQRLRSQPGAQDPA